MAKSLKKHGPRRVYSKRPIHQRFGELLVTISEYRVDVGKNDPDGDWKRIENPDGNVS